MENIEKKAENAQYKRVLEGKKKISQEDINKLIFQILVKNKLLEKLNVLPKGDFGGINQENLRGENIKNQVKKLCDFGLISEGLGEIICQKYGVAQNNSPEAQKNEEKEQKMALEGNMKDFFAKRNPVFEYLKSSGFDYSTSELEKIMKLIESVETSAKEEYMKELYNNKMKSISAPNSLANSSSGTELEAQKSFSAKEIAKMSTEEFLKNEKLINKLLSKKLIKGL